MIRAPCILRLAQSVALAGCLCASGLALAQDSAAPSHASWTPTRIVAVVPTSSPRQYRRTQRFVRSLLRVFEAVDVPLVEIHDPDFASAPVSKQDVMVVSKIADLGASAAIWLTDERRVRAHVVFAPEQGVPIKSTDVETRGAGEVFDELALAVREALRARYFERIAREQAVAVAEAETETPPATEPEPSPAIVTSPRTAPPPTPDSRLSIGVGLGGTLGLTRADGAANTAALAVLAAVQLTPWLQLIPLIDLDLGPFARESGARVVGLGIAPRLQLQALHRVGRGRWGPFVQGGADVRTFFVDPGSGPTRRDTRVQGLLGAGVGLGWTPTNSRWHLRWAVDTVLRTAPHGFRDQEQEPLLREPRWRLGAQFAVLVRL